MSPKPRSWPVQAYRGMGHLPHVGSHPGNGWMMLWMCVGGIACASNAEGVFQGAAQGILGALLMALALCPFYLCGCASRSRLSDRLERQNLHPKGQL